MDEREIILFSLIHELRLQRLCLCVLAAILWYRRSRQNEKYTVANCTFIRHATHLIYLESIIGSDIECVNQLRMDKRTFGLLCELLHINGGLKADGIVSIEEQVCMFLYILAHHVKNRTIHSRFLRSGETISRYFNLVLNAVLRLENILLRTPDPVTENCTDERWKWFKNCLGALDGTYIKVHVPEVDKPRYRRRKGEIATNVLGACSRAMMFIFVFPAWKGSASESRVLRDALSRPNGLKVPTGMEDGGGNAQVNEQDKKGGRRVWTEEEEKALLDVLEEIVATGGRADCGQFIAGTTRKIEVKLQQLLPESGLKASPHIDSKMKAWKRQYLIIFDMLNTSGFGWNDEKKCIEVDSDEAWESYVIIKMQKDGEANHFLYMRSLLKYGEKIVPMEGQQELPMIWR